MNLGPGTQSVAESTGLSVWRSQLDDQRRKIHADFLKKANPLKTLTAFSDAVDETLRTIWTSTHQSADLCLVAVGGYGRGLLYPHSDVDVLILLPADTDAGTNARVETLIGMLWDVGLEIGHSVRTVSQCQEEARGDITVQTSMLESRLIAGNKAAYARFCKAVTKTLVISAFVEGKLLEQQHRHARFNDSAQNLEPNIKEGPGGLRDLQNILWIARATSQGSNWKELTRQRILTGDEAKQLARHERTLAEYRIRLHYLAGRREDRLLFDHQRALASELGLQDTEAKRASEQLMQQFYTTAKSVTLLNNIVLQNLRLRIFAHPPRAPSPLNKLFQIRGELLETRGPGIFRKNPCAILQVFLLWQQHPEVKGLAVGTMRALWHARDLIDGDFRENPEHRALFMEILRQPAGQTHAFRRMNQYGVLGEYLPSFGRIVGQMQHDLFHVYTVDEHILMVVRNLRRFAVAEMAHEYPLCSRLMADFDKPELLFIAGLFHDIAKGRGGDHSLLGMEDARHFCVDHGLDECDTDLVVWLVEKHLYMSSVAQKQDLSDANNILAFANVVKTERRLTALYLLTVADIRGTSPKVWNAWKGKLLEDLFGETLRQLTQGIEPRERTLASKQSRALSRLRAYAIPENAHQKFWSKLDHSYFIRHDEQDIVWHTRVLNYRPDTPTPVVKARLSPIGEGLQVMIYAPDADLIFARICGFFLSIHFDIIEARIYTTKHDYVLDTFQIMNVGGLAHHYRDMISYIEHELPEWLQRGELPEPPKSRLSRQLRNFPISPAVDIRPDERGQYHYLNIVAGDRPGLLLRVARVLARYGISIFTAKINTLGERAEDTLLIKGEALDNSRITVQLESDIIAELRTDS